MSTQYRLLRHRPAIQLSALVLAVVGLAAACTKPEEPCYAVSCDTTSSSSGDPSEDLFPATKLPVDCRPENQKAYDGPNDEAPECHGPIGSGESLLLAGASSFSGSGIIDAYYDAPLDAFIVAGYGAVMKVTHAGVASMISGEYEDPANGPMKVGDGPTWPTSTIVAIRRMSDGKAIVMAEDGFYTVDVATGARAFYRDYAGVPAENHIRLEGEFALDPSDNIYVALARTTNDGGVGALQFTKSDAKVITLSGAGDPSRNVGMGPDDGVSGYASIQYYDGKVWLLNEDRDSLVKVTIETGQRQVVSSGQVGKDLPDNDENLVYLIAGEAAGAISLIFDSSKNVAYTIANNYANQYGHYQTKIDLTNGDRSYINEWFAYYRQNGFFSDAYEGTVFGKPIWLDEKNQLLYTTSYGVGIRVIELATGNYNWIIYQN